MPQGQHVLLCVIETFEGMRVFKLRRGKVCDESKSVTFVSF